MTGNEFRFFLSCDINLPVTFRVEALEGDLQDPSNSVEDSKNWSPTSELYVECALYIDGVLFGLTTRTRLAAIEKPCRWNELVTLSAKYRDLTANAQLALTVWDVSRPRQEVAVGGATLRLFNSKKQLKTGKQKLRLWRGCVGDGAIATSTPGKVPKTERGELERLEKLLNKYERGQLEHIPWLDKLTMKAMELVKEEESKRSGGTHLHLIVDLPLSLVDSWLEISSGGETKLFEPIQELGAHLLMQSPISPCNELVVVWDPEVGRQNPCENKQLKLARSVTRGMIDRDMKPSANERKEIQKILKYPPTRNLSGEERQLLWKFRFSLMSERRALTKFLRCVDWSDAQEAKQAVDLMRRWAKIDIADALELLSPLFESEEVRAYAVTVLERAEDEELHCYLLQLVQALRFERSDKSRLAFFLVLRAVQNFDLASFLRWYITVELSDPSYAKRFYSIYEIFEDSMMKITVNGREDCVGEKMWQSLPIPLPLDPTILITGIIPGESSIFKSALHPLRLTFRTGGGAKCKVIFKKGDDLRQDQLVVQLVSLMDRLLKSVNLDLHLTPYRVLATAQDEGLVEFIPSKSLAQVLSEHKTIVGYLQQFHPDEAGPFGISATCLETFVKSCAGYCVIMYILGVGDRHLDNLLLRDDGRLFHVDFGFILGRDPKPFPPPMKLCKEMVEAMGGAESQHYGRFKSYCCEAYNILRKSSNLILNLFHLMAGANIPDIASDPEKGILKLQEKFRLDLDDEEAVQFFQSLINDSVSALFPQMVETIHRWAQYWR
ncbi:hypothetical protein O6H91_05G085500 [Diphasiastrum complanatum]|uniref:Uncharacterized protein n=1 Tax=Diphasiastrum complanatum TaxID=34168 RepID=A0ACC2DQD4_DIPCM|nr:hypothetical protein O6H91_05G085500 [Diphasiastrum complanatum]